MILINEMNKKTSQEFKTTLTDEIYISNVVCTGDLNQPIDLLSFNDFEHLSSNLELYKCGYVKSSSMIGRVTVFASGKLISVGTKSPSQAYSELREASKILQAYGFSKRVKITPLVRNIVANYNTNQKIDLEKFARILPRSMYEPEQFPAIIYRIHNTATSLIFSSGKIVIVGSKSYEELNNALFELIKRLN